MTTGEKIKEVLSWSGITQKQLAGRINVSYSNFNGYMCGRHSFSVDLLRKVADELGVSLFLLLNEDPLPADHTELTEEERMVLGQYRLLTGEQREMIAQSMTLFLKQNSTKR